MYTAENYMWGWIFYSTGVVCLLSVFWLLIKKITISWIKHLLLLLLLALFFTPVTSYPDNPFLAPAFFVSLYEGFIAQGDDLGFQRGLAPILVISFFIVIVYVIGRFVVRLLAPSKSRVEQTQKSH